MPTFLADYQYTKINGNVIYKHEFMEAKCILEAALMLKSTNKTIRIRSIDEIHDTINKQDTPYLEQDVTGELVKVNPDYNYSL
jgi:hypothetical protein